jgi:hypothetical protein
MQHFEIGQQGTPDTLTRLGGHKAVGCNDSSYAIRRQYTRDAEDEWVVQVNPPGKSEAL